MRIEKDDQLGISRILLNSVDTGVVHIGPNVLEAVSEYKRITHIIKMLEQQRQAARNLVQEFMGEHTTLLDSEGVPLVRYTYNKPSVRFDLERFKVENPDLYKVYCKEVQGCRAFRLV
jgi:hypothetical protein